MSIVSPIPSTTHGSSKSPWSSANRFSYDESAHEGLSEHAHGEGETSIRDPILFRIYESDDCSMRGTLDEVSTLELINSHSVMQENNEFIFWKVLAYERALQGIEPVLLRIYESPDGFRGLYDEVIEHERKCHFGSRADTGDVEE